jgi:Ran GTPase-activating protein (RanGAP) involved in mRNA processing and transport
MSTAGYFVIILLWDKTERCSVIGTVSLFSPSRICLIAVVRLLQCNDFVTNVDLSFNAVNVVGAQALAEAISENVTLLYLNIRGNGIQPTGGLAMAEALKTNYTLKELCIADNKIGTDVATAIAARIHATVNHLKGSFRTGR